MGETWTGGGAAWHGDEARIRGLVLAESLGDSVEPDARRFTAFSSCDSSVAVKVEEDMPDFA
jgi:hypothetical protein